MRECKSCMRSMFCWLQSRIVALVFLSLGVLMAYVSAFPPLSAASPPGHIFFEQQQEAQCARHALNNCLGSSCFTVADFDAAVELILHESALAAAAADEVNVDSRELHVAPGGWYSEETIASALRKDGRWQFDQTSLFFAHGQMLGLNDDDVVGALVHVGNHWLALKFVDGKVYELDSLKQKLWAM